ncbi:MAG: DUF721 domain-containing protein [Chitinophagales bacterium]|nr:DUF721 domain-containing protein [Chitinophagales bacterium]
MKRNKEIIKVSDSFDQWLDKNHFKDKSLNIKVTENWQEIVGNTIYHHTTRIDAKLPKIFLKINNSSLKEMLYHDSNLLIDKINNYLGEDCVKEIIFT